MMRNFSVSIHFGYISVTPSTATIAVRIIVRAIRGRESRQATSDTDQPITRNPRPARVFRFRAGRSTAGHDRHAEGGDHRAGDDAAGRAGEVHGQVAAALEAGLVLGRGGGRTLRAVTA